MPISLGDVNFRLGADARNLRKSVSELQHFGKTVDAITTRTGKHSKEAAASLRRQEKAASDALRSVLQLNSKFRQTDFGAAYVRQANNAFREYNRTMTSGVISASTFDRAQTQLRANLQNTQRKFEEMKKQQDANQNSAKGLDGALRQLSQASVLIAGPLSGIAARLSTLSSLFKGSAASIALFVAGAATAIVTVATLGRSAVTAGVQMQGLSNQFLAVTGNMVLANSRMNEALRIANDAGVAIANIAPSFARFNAAARGTRLEGERAEEVFRSVALSMSIMQAPAEQIQGTMRALEQIMSKGQVQAEELRGQLGDRLPGAFQIAARAMDVTTRQLNRMLRDGEVLSETFLPRFARELRSTFGLEGVDHIDNFRASVGRVTNAFTLFFVEFDKLTGISTAVKNAIDGVTAALDFLRENLRTILASIGAVVGGLAGLAAPALASGIISVSVALFNVARSLVSVGVAMNAIPGVALLSVLTRIGLVVAGATGTFYALNRAMSMTENSFDATVESIEAFVTRQREARMSVRQTTQEMINQAQVQRTLAQMELSALEEVHAARIESWQPSIIDNFRSGWMRLFRDMPNVRDLMAIDDSDAREAYSHMNNLRSRIGRLDDALAEMNQQLATAPDNELWELTRNFETAEEDVQDLIRSVTNLENILNNLSNVGHVEDIFRLQDLNEAREIIESLNNDELVALEDSLRGAGYAGESLIDILGGIISQERHLNEIIDEQIELLEQANDPKQLARRAEALNEASRSIADNLGRVAAMADANHGALERFEDALRIRDTIEQFRMELIQANVAMETVNAMTEEFTRSLLALEAAQNSVFAEVDRQMSDAYDSAADSLNNMLVTGETSLRNLASIAQDVAQDIMRTFLEISLTNPLKNILFDTNLPTLFGGQDSQGAVIQEAMVSGGSTAAATIGAAMVQSGATAAERMAMAIARQDITNFNFDSVFEEAGNTITEAQNIANAAQEQTNNTFLTRMSSTFDKAVSGIQGIFSGLLNGLSGLFSSIGGGLGSIFSGAKGLAGSLLSLIPGFATGGSFTVGGRGGVDNNLVQFKASRGERVDILTPAQQMAQASSGQGGNILKAYIDARGATKDAIPEIIQQLKALGYKIEKMDRSLPDKVRKTLSEDRERLIV